MSKHTPGPWWASGTEVGAGPTMAIKVAKVSGANYAQAVENAKLIAAAPELLDHLNELERSISALLAHQLLPPIAPEYRDIYAAVINARNLVSHFSSTGESNVTTDL